jgi:hypothetical protein
MLKLRPWHLPLGAEIDAVAIRRAGCDSDHKADERVRSPHDYRLREVARCCFTKKRTTNMTKTEIKNDILTDAELDGVIGGLNPQPLPPSPPPPPEGFHSFATGAFNRF